MVWGAFLKSCCRDPWDEPIRAHINMLRRWIEYLPCGRDWLWTGHKLMWNLLKKLTGGVQCFDDEVFLVLCLTTKFPSKLNAVRGFLGYPVLCIRYNLICVSNYTDTIVSYALTFLYNSNFFLIVRHLFFTHYTEKKLECNSYFWYIF